MFGAAASLPGLLVGEPPPPRRSCPPPAPSPLSRCWITARLRPPARCAARARVRLHPLPGGERLHPWSALSGSGAVVAVLLPDICPRFRTEGLMQQETLEILPKAMQSSISLYLFFPVVQGSYLFKGVSSGFIQQLVMEMQAEYFAPKEDIVLQNEKPSNLYLLVSGAVDILAFLDGTEQIYGKATEGELLGEIGVMSNKPQPFTFRTTKLSQPFSGNYLQFHLCIAGIESTVVQEQLLLSSLWTLKNFRG